jgi:hypothetical protein
MSLFSWGQSTLVDIFTLTAATANGKNSESGLGKAHAADVRDLCKLRKHKQKMNRYQHSC